MRKLTVLFVFLAACGGGKTLPGDPAEPAFSVSLFTAGPSMVTHAHFPLRAGETRIYRSETEDGVEIVVEQVLDEIRTVAGVNCAVVRVREYLDELLIEDTRDWYAQDDEGNVWYMGEEVVNYEYDDDGNLVDTNDDGAWEAGVDGARAGILLWAQAVVGRSHYQDFYEGEAEDMAVVVATGVTVELADGTVFTGCLRVLERTPLEPEALETKYLAPGIGVVVEVDEAGGERVEILPAP